ncbi:hypothetical protein [Bradyrhizobium vignae]|uniref:Uncharacterized protein n=1 Tax=Bradyrhizobium vignae TaxID=1549949 RepID=A0ABS4A7Q7_9BRAD|nr:hypothetical protein [Bradyrhizobium vignae]MBP0116452.1 hypothetical protein [Bradyrhizobium vignae]
MPSAALLNLDSGSFDVMLSRGVRIMAYDAAMKTIMDEVAADLSWFVSHPCDLIQRLESCTTRGGLNSRLSPYARRVVTFFTEVRPELVLLARLHAIPIQDLAAA